MVSYDNFKICVISPLGYTGMAYYNHSLCQSLSELGLDITLITSQKIVAKPKKVSYKIVRLFRNTYGDINRFKKGLAYIFCMLSVCIYIVRSRFKIVHFQLLELPPIDSMIFFLLKSSGIKIVYTPHDIHSFKPGQGMKLQRLLYKLSDIVIVHNRNNSDLLLRAFELPAGRIEIIPHGNYNYFLKLDISPDIARENINIPGDKKMILLFGSIRTGKGIETAVRAMKFLKNEKDVLLLIAGKPARGYDIGALEEEIGREGLSGMITLRNSFINDSMVEYYYRAANMIIVPYERIYESGALRYAFSCGKPTVISNSDIFSEFARDGESCLIFERGNPLDLAKKISYLLKHPDAAQTIARGAKELSDREWSWSTAAGKTKKIYEKLL